MLCEFKMAFDLKALPTSNYSWKFEMDYYISFDSLMINLTNVICKHMLYIVFVSACAADCQMLGMYKLLQKQDRHLSAICNSHCRI